MFFSQYKKNKNAFFFINISIQKGRICHETPQSTRLFMELSLFFPSSSRIVFLNENFPVIFGYETELHCFLSLRSSLETSILFHYKLTLDPGLEERSSLPNTILNMFLLSIQKTGNYIYHRKKMFCIQVVRSLGCKGK